MFRFRRGEWRANTVRPYEKVSYICVILSKRSASKDLRTIDRPVDPSIRLRLTQDDKILEAVRCREGIAGREKCGKNDIFSSVRGRKALGRKGFGIS